jgi:hypothetical protein
MISLVMLLTPWAHAQASPRVDDLVDTASPRVDDLVDAESLALEIIEACTDRRDCAYDRHELGGAFLVRATAAAVLRGEVDTVAAANARLLVPSLALAWDELMPSVDSSAPDAWVVAWLPSVTPAGDLDTESGAPAAVSERLSARRGDRVARVGLTGSGGSDFRTGGLVFDARSNPVRGLGLLTGFDVGLDSSRIATETREALGIDVPAINGRRVSANLGIGPRWTAPEGSEFLIYFGASYGTSWASHATFKAITDEGFYLSPAIHHIGLSLGLLGVWSVAPHFSVRTDLSLASVKRVMAARHHGRRSPPPGWWPEVDRSERDGIADDHVITQLALELHRDLGERAFLYGGLETRIVTVLDVQAVPEHMTDIYLWPRLGVGWGF